jgi:hypothetical protein
MATVGKLNVSLVANTAQFTAGLQRASKQVSSFATDVAGMAAGVAKWGAAAAAAAAAAGGYLVKQSLATIDAQAKVADSLGITTTALTGMQYAAGLSGASTEDLNKSLREMSRTVADATAGVPVATKALKDLGLSASELAGLRPEDQFGRFADAINRSADAGAKLNASNDIFKKSGLQIQAVLASGSAGLAQQRAEAERLGITFSRFDAAKVEQANDAFSRVAAILGGVVNRAAIALAPIIQGVSDDVVAMAGRFGGAGAIIDRTIDLVVEFGANVYSVARNAYDVLGEFFGALVDVGAGFLGAADRAGYLNSLLGVMRGSFQGLKLAGVSMGEAIINVLLYYDSKFQQVSTLVRDGFALVKNAGLFAWESIRVAVTYTIAYMGVRFAWMLDQAGAAVGVFNSAMGQSMGNAATALRSGTAEYVEEAEARLADLGAAVKTSAEDFAQSAAVAINPFNASGQGAWSATLSALKTEYHEAGIETATAFWKAYDGVDVVRAKAWVTAAYTRSAAAAQASADGVAAAQSKATAEAAILASMKSGEDAAMAADAARWRAGLDQEILAEDEFYNKKLAKLKEYNDKKFTSDAEHRLLVEQEETAHQERINQIQRKSAMADWKKKDLSVQLSDASNFFDGFAALSQTHNKKLQRIGKAAAMASAVASTAAGIMKCFEQFGIWGVVPAAAVAAAGAVQIAAIASSDSGGGGVRAPSGAVPALPGATPGDNVPDTNPFSRNTQQLTIVVNGAMVGREGINQMIDEINAAQRDGKPVQLVAA